jgi:hypothetical protein
MKGESDMYTQIPFGVPRLPKHFVEVRYLWDRPWHVVVRPIGAIEPWTFAGCQPKHTWRAGGGGPPVHVAEVYWSRTFLRVKENCPRGADYAASSYSKSATRFS